MPQLRNNPVTREWVIIASERSRRPSDFGTIEHAAARAPFSPSCPFCPGNEMMTPPEVLSFRTANSLPNGPGWWVRVVPNKFPALLVEGDLDRVGFGMYDQMNGLGAHEVVVECAEHDRTIADVSHAQAEDVLWAYRERCEDLSRDVRFKYVMLFRNHGRVAGGSLEHAHSQLIALPMVPQNVLLQVEGAARYREYHDRCIFCDMVRQELNFGERVVCENEDFIAFCPFAAKHPFETWILPRHHRRSYQDEERPKISSFAAILQEMLGRLSRCLGDPPYNFTLHSSPINLDREVDFHWHVAIMPRLTIAAGFELGTGMHINVTAPEDAAKHLRNALREVPPVDAAESSVKRDL